MKLKDIIQKLLNTFENRKYLELGISDGKIFENVKAEYKEGVGKIKTPIQIQNLLNDGCKYFHMSNNEYLVRFNDIDGIDKLFNVVFINAHEFKQAYYDVNIALDCISKDGIIIVHNCKPTNEIIGLPPSIYNLIDTKIKKENKNLWTGDVWKSITLIRSTYDNLCVFTLDCAWGCAIITRGNPESKLSFSETEIKAMNFEDFENNCSEYLNLKPAKYLNEYIVKCLKKEKTSLYVEDAALWEEHCSNDFYIRESLKIIEVENAIILPIKRISNKKYPARSLYAGGVCDSEGNFVAGLRRKRDNPDIHRSCSYAYKVTDDMIKKIEETVVFGGVLEEHFGHFIFESLSRLWWWIENQNCSYKIAFVRKGTFPDAFLEFLHIAGIDYENIILIKEPKRFNKVIIPDQANYFFGGYTNKFLNIYNTIRNNIETSGYKKIYLTRTQLFPKDTVNEEFFEEYYRSIGYKVISLEQYTIREQLSILLGAKEIACVAGTLAHLILFSNDNIKLTVLNRAIGTPVMVQLLINQAKSVTCTFIDVSMNLLPSTHPDGCFFLAPTVYWKRFLKDMNERLDDENFCIDNYALDYIKLWASTYADINSLRWVSKASIVDVVYILNKYLLNRELNKKKLEEKLYPTP